MHGEPLPAAALGELPNRLLTAFEVAQFVGCHEETIRRADYVVDLGPERRDDPDRVDLSQVCRHPAEARRPRDAEEGGQRERAAERDEQDHLPRRALEMGSAAGGARQPHLPPYRQRPPRGKTTIEA